MILGYHPLCVCAQVLSLATPWTIAHQAPLSMEFYRQEYWSGLAFPSPGDLPNPRIQPTSLVSLALAVQFSHSIMSDSLWPHGLQCARLPCSSPSPGVCSNWCPLSQWCHSTISFSVAPFPFYPESFIRVFSDESALCIRWPKYWSFSFNISPSNVYSGLISFRFDWLVQGSPKDSQESSPAPQFESINSLVLSLL